MCRKEETMVVVALAITKTMMAGPSRWNLSAYQNQVSIRMQNGHPKHLLCSGLHYSSFWEIATISKKVKHLVHSKHSTNDTGDVQGEKLNTTELRHLLEHILANLPVLLATTYRQMACPA